jgi:hypothetical protein
MAQTNNTTLQLYYSPTATAVPSAGNLAFGELAINILDEKLYFKNSSGVVKLLASPSGATGTVQSVSVVSANGLAGTVATATTTPAITLSTTITGILKGNGTAISAAVASTDYAPATSGTSILKGNGTGGFANAVASTDYAPVTTGTSILKANGTGGFANAVASTDYAPATSGTSILYGNGTGGFSSVTVAAPLTFTTGTLGLGPVTAGTSILYGDGAGGISNVTIGTGVSFVAGTLSATGSGGTVTSVTGTSPVASSGGNTPAISLEANYGDTQNPYASKTANFVLAAPNGSAGAPTFRALLAADVPTLNQNTTGNAGGLSTTNWTVFQSGTKLFFAYNGVDKMSIDSSGNIITVGNVTAFGTP